MGGLTVAFAASARLVALAKALPPVLQRALRYAPAAALAAIVAPDVLVVGGGDSAIEAAVGLAIQKGNTVTLSYRKGEFTRIKERNKQHIEEYGKSKKISIIFNSDVKEIRSDSVLLSTAEGDKEIPNDYVFVFAGGELPFDFLKKIGIEMHVQQM